MLSFTIPRMTFDEFIHRLQNAPQVLGLLAMGSTGKPHFKSFSDYDLVIVLEDNAPPLFTASTWIDGKLGDFYFFYRTQIETLIRGEQGRAGGFAKKLTEWVQTGTILFDRTGLLEGLKSTANAQSQTLLVKDTDAIHRTWFGINFNFVHNNRFFNSGDKLYRQALEIRLLYCQNDLLIAYFILRGLPWEGEKTAIPYLQKHDPEYSELFFRTLRETQLENKFALYTALVERTLSGYGGVWNENEGSVLMNDKTPAHDGIDWLKGVLAID